MIGKNYIWIVCEYDQYDSVVSLQLIQKAKELKDKKNAEIWAVCIGSLKTNAFEVIHEYGVSDILFEQQGQKIPHYRNFYKISVPLPVYNDEHK